MIKMKTAVILCAFAVGAASAFQKDDDWTAFKIKFGKRYSKEDDSRRKDIFFDNVEHYNEHNSDASQGRYTFTLGVHEYSDMSQDEIQDTLNGFKGIDDHSKSGKPFVAPEADIPATVDWRKSGLVTAVKNQGQCGSCWAFSSTGALEAVNAKKTGKLVSLSEQNLVDCVKTNAGCGGGWMDNAFNYVENKTGIDTEAYYPYLGVNWYCFFNPAPQDVGGHCNGHVDIPKGNETALLYAVATHGPVSVAIDAAHSSFSGYKTGVFYEPSCSTQNLDHAVLVVGYGNENGQDYWLVKNSWGASWGDQGYIKMSRNRDNNCGIATAASFPTA